MTQTIAVAQQPAIELNPLYHHTPAKAEEPTTAHEPTRADTPTEAHEPTIAHDLFRAHEPADARETVNAQEPVNAPEHPDAQRLLNRLRAFVGQYQVGPFTIAFFAVIVALVRRFSPHNQDSAYSIEELSSVSIFYGPGSYSGWLIDAVAAVCQSEPKREGRGERGESEQDSDKIWVVQLIPTIVVAIYACAAAVLELRSICHDEQNTLSHAAFDRVAQVSWILSTFYLLHCFWEGGRPRGESQCPSLRTAVWMLVWWLVTIAMSVDNIVRGTLRSTAIKVFLPFCIGITLPILIVCFLAYLDYMSWGWEITALNAGTMALSITYVFTPPSARYDPNSPAAPLSGSKISDLDQAAALAAGLVVAIPLVLLLGERGTALLRSLLQRLRGLSCWNSCRG